MHADMCEVRSLLKGLPYALRTIREPGKKRSILSLNQRELIIRVLSPGILRVPIVASYYQYLVIMSKHMYGVLTYCTEYGK